MQIVTEIVRDSTVFCVGGQWAVTPQKIFLNADLAITRDRVTELRSSSTFEDSDKHSSRQQASHLQVQPPFLHVSFSASDLSNLL